MKRSYILPFLGVLLWVPISLTLISILAITILPDIIEQPLSYAKAVYGDNDPADWVLLFSGFFVLFIVPLLAILIRKFFLTLSKRWGICYKHTWIALSYLALTATLIWKAAYDVISLPALFGYFLAGTACCHFFAKTYRDQISATFYKYLEYIYIFVAIGGLLPAAEPLSIIYAYRIDVMTERIGAAHIAKASGDCDGNWATDACLDYDKHESLISELESLKASKPQKPNLLLRILGYLMLTLALNVKLLKISGELYKWHRRT